MARLLGGLARPEPLTEGDGRREASAVAQVLDVLGLAGTEEGLQQRVADQRYRADREKCVTGRASRSPSMITSTSSL
jgi:hypothetical protein